jgi:hypothetical protein
MQIQKTIAFTIILGLCVSSAFAEFTVGGGVDMVVVPVQVVTKDTTRDEGNVWVGSGIGANQPLQGIKTRLTLEGNYEETIGFRTDILFLYTNNGANLWNQPAGSNPSSPNSHDPNAMEVRLGDNGNAWWRPAEWLRFDVGRVYNTSLTGVIHDHWLALWSIGMFDGNNIFSYYYSGSIGVLAQFTPTFARGLTVNAFVPQFGMPFTQAQFDDAWPYEHMLTSGGDTLNDTSETGNRNVNRASRVFERTWVTVAYGDGETYLARMQFIGANAIGRINWTSGADGEDTTEPHKYRISLRAPRIETAFALNLERLGLLFDVGVKSWLPIANWITDTWDSDMDSNQYIRLQNTGTYWGGIGFGFAIAYNGLLGGDLVLCFRADGDMLRSWQGLHEGRNASITNPVRLSFHLWPFYKIEGVGTITANAGINYIGRNTVEIAGVNPNANSDDWNNASRLRFGAGLSFDMPIGGSSLISAGLAYRHGTAEGRGEEPRAITIPIRLFYQW